MKKILFLLIISIYSFAQKLPRSVPEKEGVSSQGILNFIRAWEESDKHEPHSFMVLRHGKVVAEGWWNPYAADLPHTMYSVSKSFTATAIGFAVHEGKLSLDDAVISFFPDQLPSHVSDNLKKLKVKHLLTMSAGNIQEPLYMMAEEDWVRAFLRSEFGYEPGSRFMYNSPATYMLSAILQKVTGMRLSDYLTPRLFEPLGIQNADWEVDPYGINVGGWGLRIKTEDMAKFGQLFLQRGIWRGKQVLPVDWVEEARKAQIFQPQPVSEELLKNSDWYQGYGYQMWRGRNNTYRADGAFGQNIIVLPEKDAVIITTGESSDLQGMLNLIWDKLLPALKDEKMKADKVAFGSLSKKLKDLSLPSAGATLNKEEESKRWVLLSPYKTLKAIRLDYEGEQGRVTFETDSVNHTIPFGKNKWVTSKTTMKGPYIFPKINSNRSNIPQHGVAGSYGWKDNNTMVLELKYIESMHTETFTLRLNEESPEVLFDNIIIRNSGDHAARLVADKSNESSPKLIIRGDDMGYSHSGNVALLKSSLEGIQKSIEVIAPSPWFPEAVKMLNEHPGIDVGLHFALTSEWDNIKWRPLTAAPSLRDIDGYFFPMILKNNLYPGQAITDNPWKLEDVETELRAQIEMVKRHIPWLSHISGHMGCTIFTPEVKEMVRRVAAEYKLPVVDSDAMKDFGIEYIWIDPRNKSSDGRIDAFIQLLGKLQEDKTYVFLEHPGLDNEELRAIHHLGYENVAEDRQSVTDLFTSEKVKKVIYERGIRLVSYKDVLGK